MVTTYDKRSKNDIEIGAIRPSRLLKVNVSSASVNYYSLLNYDSKSPYTEVDEISLKWPPFVHLDISSKPFHVQNEITE